MFPNSKFILVTAAADVEGNNPLVQQNGIMRIAGSGVAWNSMVRSMVDQCQKLGTTRCRQISHKSLVQETEQTMTSLMNFLAIKSR